MLNYSFIEQPPAVLVFIRWEQPEAVPDSCVGMNELLVQKYLRAPKKGYRTY